MFTELIPKITTGSGSLKAKEESIALFLTEFDIYFGKFLDDLFSLNDFLQSASTIFELTKDFHYRDNKNLSSLFFMVLNEIVSVSDYFKESIQDTNTYENIYFSNLNESIQEVFISLDSLLTADKRPEEYLSDIQERDLEVLDFEIIASLNFTSAEDLIIKQFEKQPDIDFKDLIALSKIASQKTIDLLKNILYSGKYHGNAEITSMALLLAVVKVSPADLFKTKQSLWNVVDPISGKSFSELVEFWFTNMDKGIQNPAYLEFVNAKHAQFNYFAVLLIQFLELEVTFSDFKLIKSILSNKAGMERISEQMQDGEEYFYIAESFAFYLNSVSLQSLKTIFSTDDSFNEFMSFAINLPESVFNYLSPVIYLAYDSILGEVEFVKRLELVIHNKDFKKSSNSSMSIASAEALKLNLSMLARLFSLDLEGSTIRELRFA